MKVSNLAFISNILHLALKTNELPKILWLVVIFLLMMWGTPLSREFDLFLLLAVAFGGPLFLFCNKKYQQSVYKKYIDMYGLEEFEEEKRDNRIIVMVAFILFILPILTVIFFAILVHYQIIEPLHTYF